ncbi:hypothetical protein ScPMuIL_012073 [Solemya velum]
MASTKAILNNDHSINCNSTASTSGEALEEVVEELDPNDSLPRLDLTEPRFETVQELLRSERTFCFHLRSILDTYAEPLRKFSSLTIDDHRILFVGVEPILSLSAMLSSKLEETLRTWDSSNTCIGDLFSRTFWNHFDEYCGTYQKTKDFLEQKQKTDESFTDFCSLRRGKSKYCLEELLSLPSTGDRRVFEHMDNFILKIEHNSISSPTDLQRRNWKWLPVSSASVDVASVFPPTILGAQGAKKNMP